MKRILKCIGILLLVIVLAAAGLITYLTVTEFKPEDTSVAETEIHGEASLETGQTLKILSWNTGYAGLDANADFFMDGGTKVKPDSQTTVENNMAAIADFIHQGNYDICLLQEVDRNSARTENTDELSFYSEETGYGWVYAANYRCNFVPYPLPPIGKVESGITTMSNLLMPENAERISLPCPFSWPVRAANLKRCLLVSRYSIEGTDKELVTVNLHLEAYDDGAGKEAQAKALMELLQKEYEKGNYVIAGGDFNQSFPGTLEAYPILDPDTWTPGIVDEAQIPDGWSILYDSSTPSCRLLNQPYDPESDKTQYYVIDGFIASPNITVHSVETINLEFANSDHNPVQLEIELN